MDPTYTERFIKFLFHFTTIKFDLVNTKNGQGIIINLKSRTKLGIEYSSDYLTIAEGISWRKFHLEIFFLTFFSASRNSLRIKKIKLSPWSNKIQICYYSVRARKRLNRKGYPSSLYFMSSRFHDLMLRFYWTPARKRNDP